MELLELDKLLSPPLKFVRCETIQIAGRVIGCGWEMDWQKRKDPHARVTQEEIDQYFKENVNERTRKDEGV
jgi:hypothetical protein